MTLGVTAGVRCMLMRGGTSKGLYFLASDLPFIARFPILFTLLALAYLVCLAVRVLGAAYGPVRWRPALTAMPCSAR